MSTEKQRAASRANGAQSRGPTTPVGKAASSRNALFHGLTADRFILPDEDPDAASLLLDSYVASLQPVGPVETDLAREVALARWRLFRAARVEAGIVESSVEDRAEWVNSGYVDPTPTDHVVAAFERLLHGHRSALDRIGFYESRLRRFYTRALQELLQLQKLREPKCKNEPDDQQTLPNQQTDPCCESSELSDDPLRISP